MPLELGIISILAGIALGLRYKVLILFPALAFAVVFSVIGGIAQADHFWSIILTTVISGTSVQLGYLAGIAMRAAVERAIVVVRPQQKHARQEAPSAIDHLRPDPTCSQAKSRPRAA